MSGRLQNKKVVVTAAAHGIGKAIATEFAVEGAEVMATDIDGDALDSVTGIVGINTQILDVTDGDAVANFAAAMGTIDVLCNIAGFVHHGSVLDVEEKDWDFSFDLNVKSMYRTIRAFLPGMLAAGNGSIINLSLIHI